MKKMKQLLAALLALILCLTAVAAFAEEAEDNVLATVNGEAVMQSEVDDFTDYLISYFAQYGYDMSGEDDLHYLRSLALENMISRALIRQKAKELGLDQLTDEELREMTEENDAMWESAIQNYIDYYEPLAEDATEADRSAARMDAIAFYESQGYTMESTLNDSIENLVSERVYAEIVKDAAVTDEDVLAAFDAAVAADKDYYGNNIDMYEYTTQYYGQESYYQPEGYRGVIHILLKVDDDLMAAYEDLQARYEEQQQDEEAGEADEAEEPVTEEQVAAAREAIFASVQPTIDEIIQKFNDGTPFEDLIAEYGTDPGMTYEENLKNGYAVHASSILWDPVFTAAAMSIPEVGGISEPVLGNYGIHIVYYLRDIPGGAVELTDDIRAALREQVLSEKEQELYSLTMQEWMDSADIVYSELAQESYLYPDDEIVEDAETGAETETGAAGE